MSLSAGSMMARASSGSRSRISSVEPLISANSAVTALRSPSGSPSAAREKVAADSAECSLAPWAPVAGERAAPQSQQKRLVSGFSAPHLAQRILLPELTHELVEQCLGIFQVGGVETLGEP